MRSPLVAIVLLLALLAVLLFSFLRDTRAVEERLLTADGGPAVSESSVDLAILAEPESVPDRLVIEELAAEPTAEAEPAAADTGLVTLTGTWTIHDANDLQRNGEDGQFILRQYVPRKDIEIAVVAGRFSVELAADARFDIREVELGGRRTEPIGNVGDLAIPPDRHLGFAARWVSAVVLTVVDAQTRAELSGLIVVGRGLGSTWKHPGTFDPERVIMRDVRSPVILPIPDYASDSEPLWVHAPGYGWGHIVVPRSVGGEFLLALHPGGSLSVNVIGAPPGVALILRLRTNEDPEDYEGIHFETPLEGRAHVELEHLRVGRYFASVEIGHRYRYPHVLAAQEAHIRAGERTEVDLDATGFALPPLASIAGRLVVPPEWDFASFGIHFDLIGQAAIDGQPQRYVDGRDMQVMDPERGEYAFELSEAQAGQWELRFNPVGTSISVELPPAGVHDVRLEVPPPAVVAVRVRDEEGKPVSDVNVHWMPDREGLASGGVLSQAGETAPGTFQFTTPVGRVDVWVMSSRWSFRRETFAVEEGENAVTIETTLACGLVLRVRDGDTQLRVEDFAPRITLVGGEESCELIDEDYPGLEQRFLAPTPGAYRVELTPPEGYLSVDPFELTVPAREFVEHVVDVYRR